MDDEEGKVSTVLSLIFQVSITITCIVLTAIIKSKDYDLTLTEELERNIEKSPLYRLEIVHENETCESKVEVEIETGNLTSRTWKGVKFCKDSQTILNYKNYFNYIKTECNGDSEINCGVIDSEGQFLCVPSSTECPTNYIGVDGKYCQPDKCKSIKLSDKTTLYYSNNFGEKGTIYYSLAKSDEIDEKKSTKIDSDGTQILSGLKYIGLKKSKSKSSEIISKDILKENKNKIDIGKKCTKAVFILLIIDFSFLIFSIICMICTGNGGCIGCLQGLIYIAFIVVSIVSFAKFNKVVNLKDYVSSPYYTLMENEYSNFEKDWKFSLTVMILSLVGVGISILILVLGCFSCCCVICLSAFGSCFQSLAGLFSKKTETYDDKAEAIGGAEKSGEVGKANEENATSSKDEFGGENGNEQDKSQDP
jgi:uncharacterized membrane protein